MIRRRRFSCFIRFVADWVFSGKKKKTRRLSRYNDRKFVIVIDIAVRYSYRIIFDRGNIIVLLMGSRQEAIIKLYLCYTRPWLYVGLYRCFILFEYYGNYYVSRGTSMGFRRRSRLETGEKK